MIEIVPASVRHIGPLSREMRAIDRTECAIFGHTPKQALRMGLRTSAAPQVALVDGVPACMFGIMPVSIINRHGRPWLLGTDAMVRHGLALCVGARRYVEAAARIFTRMDNWVAADNAAAIQWLARLGFVLGETREIGGVTIRHFEWRQDDV